MTVTVEKAGPEAYRAAREALLSGPLTDPATRREQLSRLTDDWVQALFEQAGADPRTCSLVAIGGYGRRELAPGSDIDLLLLHAPGTDVSAFADRIWYPIWDSGVKLDHSVRTPVQARRLANSDLKVMLGLIDGRTIAGDESLFAGLRASSLSDWRARAAVRLPELHVMMINRRETFGELAYLQEPDLKESLGGLRDLTIMRAIAASWVTDVPRASLTAPHQLLLDVRDALHTATGRGSDKLLRQEQPAVAELLGIPDPNGDGDGVLRAVAAAGRTIDWASDMVWHRVERLDRPSKLPGLRRLRGPKVPSRVPLTDGAVVSDGEVVLARDARPGRDPALILRVAAASARAGLRIAPATLNRLAETCGSPPLPWSDEMRNSFVGLIGAGRGTIPVWESLDQEDLITRLLPEWADTRSAPQHNPVHIHTVDRHMLETAVQASTRTRDVSRPDLLLVAAILHDIGKPAGAARHSEVGAELVGEMAPRMGFSQDDTEVLVSLVTHHLLLADTATRRDIDDPATIASVAEKVGRPDVLELLLALTLADAKATGPAAWSPWRAALVEALVERVTAQLAGLPPEELPGPSEVELAAEQADDVVVMHREIGGLEELTIGAPASRDDLADAAGVLALHRLQVIDMHARTTDTRAVSTWRVTSAFGEPPDAQRIAVDLRRVVNGTLDIKDRLRRRENSFEASQDAPAPRVVVVPAASESATVIEVRAADSAGLLHRLLRAVEAGGATIRAAKVATLGQDVVDVFYLVGDDGSPLSGDAGEDLRAALIDAAQVPIPAGAPGS